MLGILPATVGVLSASRLVRFASSLEGNFRRSLIAANDCYGNASLWTSLRVFLLFNKDHKSTPVILIFGTRKSS